jgi:hypothetical protein
MGAVRRWYDTITAQLAGINSNFGNFLPLSGGTISGNLSVTGTMGATVYTMQGVALASREAGANGHIIYDGAGEVCISLYPTDAYYRNTQHIFQNNSGTTTVYINNVGDLYCNYGVSIAASLGAAAVHSGYIYSTGNVAADNDVTASGAVHGSYIHSTADIAADNNVRATNAITGATIGASYYLSDGMGVLTTTTASTPFGGRTAPTLLNEGGAAAIQAHSYNNIHRSDAHIFNKVGSADGALYAASFNATSDRRLKIDIEPSGQGLTEVLKLSPVSFKRIDASERQVGFVAQDVEAVLPEAVTSIDLDGQATLAVNNMPIIAALVNAIKDISTRLESLETIRN